jgi:uncharacterized protein (DUF305 family)
MQGWLTKWDVKGGSGNDMAGMNMGSGDHGMGMSDADMASLRKAVGAEFDRTFLTMMTAHHNGAIQMASDELDKGKYKPAKNLAGSIRGSQQQEVAEMQGILARVGAP